MLKTLVVANGEPPSYELLHELVKSHSQLVAVDGGIYTCLKYGLEPHLIMGDFDSISQKTLDQLSNIPQLHVANQNKSDLEKTIDHLLQKPHSLITVCAALGKRLDHTLTNICLLSRYPGKIKFETDTETTIALPKSSVITCKPGQILSLIPLDMPATEVFTQGLKWELQGNTLDKNFVSISNVCLGTSVSITFSSGSLIACLKREEGIESLKSSESPPHP